MRVRIGQDAMTGLLFAAIGIAGLWIGWNYPMGTPQKPGTGVLPAMLCAILIVVGCFITLRAFLRGDAAITGIDWRATSLLTLSTVAFGLLIDHLGLALTMIISLTICALGVPDTRWREYAIFLAFMIAVGWFTFIWLLGMPIAFFDFKW